MVANGAFQQTFGIGGVAGNHYFEAWGVCVPVLKRLRVLLCQLTGATCWTAENDRTSILTVAHAIDFSCRVDYLVDGNERKVEGHEFANRAQTVHGCTHGDTGKTQFGDGGIDDPFFTKFCQHALAYFICTIVFCHFFT